MPIAILLLGMLAQSMVESEALGEALFIGALVLFLVGVAVAALYHDHMTRRFLRETDRLRVDLQDRIQRGDLSELPPTGVGEMDVILEEFNAILRHARQRMQVTTTITSAARHRAAEGDRDRLTDLYNRRFLNAHLPNEVGRTKALSDELSVIMIDVDHFKHYNDTNGHPAGDEVLRSVGELLCRTVRALDFCVRYGGEEFLVILPRTTLERARRTAERIRAAIGSHPFEAREAQPGGALTVSLGVASLPRHASTADELIQRADEALYAAKQAGRNQVKTADEPAAPAGQGDPGKPTL